jgi:CubicO group peptidase (beta-lactamase class C family)
MILRLSLVFLGVVSGIVSAQAPRDTSAIFSDIQSADPGCAALVVNHGKTVFKEGFGVTNLDQPTPITSSTNFRLASVTKQFTAASIMLLVRDGKLKYEDHLTDLFPQFPPYAHDITVHNLLNHTGGLLDYEDLWDGEYPNTPPDKLPQIRDAQVLQLLVRQETGRFPAGTRFAYSNSGYSVLSQIVEKISGQPFEDFLRTRIFMPLGMKNTVAFVDTRNLVPNRSYGYRKEKGQWVFSDQSSTSAVLGDGGIYSSLDDFEKWIEVLRAHKLLTAEEMAPALIPVNLPKLNPNSEESASYGFGWFLDPYKGHRRMYHTGTTIGFLNAIHYFPDDDLAVVVLCNRTDVKPSERALKMADLFLKQR